MQILAKHAIRITRPVKDLWKDPFASGRSMFADVRRKLWVCRCALPQGDRAALGILCGVVLCVGIRLVTTWLRELSIAWVVVIRVKALPVAPM